ncbi:hypothetical protein LTR41_011834 [Exophiala xenobiotica]|nr:hypothetical protein LTR41_011834 [Exophiala xenobiotica]KAK5550222.1 hypothetical protein LTR46_011775 [Exophiala xenobiotica]
MELLAVGRQGNDLIKRVAHYYCGVSTKAWVITVKVFDVCGEKSHNIEDDKVNSTQGILVIYVDKPSFEWAKNFVTTRAAARLCQLVIYNVGGQSPEFTKEEVEFSRKPECLWKQSGTVSRPY